LIFILPCLPNGELSRAGAGCRLAEPDGEATRGSSELLGGALFSCAAHKTLAKQLAVERRVCAPLK